MSYEIKKTGRGEFMFNLKAGNGEIILTSESYAQKASALTGIESVRKNGPDDQNYESKMSVSGQPYFVLKAANGQVIGRSEMYSSAAAKDSGIASVKKNCTSDVVKDTTET